MNPVRKNSFQRDKKGFSNGMNRIKPALPIVFISLFLFSAQAVSGTETKKSEPAAFTIADFNNGAMSNNLQAEMGTWETDPEDESQGIEASLDRSIKMGRPGCSLRLDYNVGSPKNAVNGFWMQLKYFDASPYDHFEFFVKGDVSKGFTTVFKIEFKKLRKGPDGEEETAKGSFIVKGVTGEWQKISVPLNVMNGITDWRELGEFVITFEKRRVDSPRGTLYFDDFAFVKTGSPGPSIGDAVEHGSRKTKTVLPPADFAKFLIRRLNGFPSKVFLKKPFPADDRAMLLEIALDTWNYFNMFVDRNYQLPIDNVEFAADGTVSKETKVGDYTNITNVGLYLMCVVAGYDFRFITKEDALNRLRLTLDSIERLEKYKNFPYNYYDITLFQRTSNFVSFVDSGWLAAGLVVIKNAFPETLGERCRKILDGMDFSFFYDGVEECMYHGFYTNIKYYSDYSYGLLYTEPRAVSYLAIGKGDVPKDHWFKLARTFPDTWAWQTQMPKGRREKVYLGCVTEGGYYTYNGVKFVPSWGGSMFEALMPAIIIDEKRLAAKGLGANDERHVDIQIKYALEKLSYPVFGMSPSCVPEGGYTEYGVKPLGIKGYKPGVIAPYATFLALEFAPKECIANIRRMLALYNAYGECGFYDAINVETGKAAIKYLCLDQAMSFLALDNYLNDGAIRRRFAADPINKRAEELLKVEDFFD